MTRRTNRQASRARSSFHQDLVLNRWMLKFFNRDSIQKLKLRLGESRHEGFHDDGQTLFFHELTGNLFNIDLIEEKELRRYDLNIGEHWKAITEQRNKLEGHTLQMKYFQYLSLLFTEIYLDWYFNRRQQLLDGLNEELEVFHGDLGDQLFQKYRGDEINKIAFWNATGSGKTLLLHGNILQYLHYFQQGNTSLYPDKILILTPNEGLSKQHLEEAQRSGFPYVELFDKTKQSGFRNTIEIIDINKLSDTMGDKTVAVEAFEGNNLVLVDEGHRGTGKEAEAWMRRRLALISNGFAFEYSATFGQAVGKGKTIAKAEEDLTKEKAKIVFNTNRIRDISAEDFASISLTKEEKQKARMQAMRETYAKCTLFDYSYKFFYDDGYGKEFLILNLKEATEDEKRSLYFTACLLAFYQQIWLFESHRDQLRDYNLEKPLWVFVGNKVSDDDSDILVVLEYLAQFINNRSQMEQWIGNLISDTAEILGPKGRNIFLGRFRPLMGRTADEVYTDIIKRLFNSDAGQRLKLVNIKNSKGELALRVGDAKPFGLINIGDDSGFYKTAEERTTFDSEADDFGEPLFQGINKKGSSVNLLIGSRKFTEGWSSWRVSTMGLLNMGTGEGSQIIQLFGRGVRLKGVDFSLKRTTASERPKGVHLDKLETLNIFGVRANYMAKFKEYLREEGITPTDEILELDFPTQSNLPARKLKTLQLKDGYKDNQKNGFKRTHFPELYEIPEAFIDADTGAAKIKMPHVVVDMYPRVEALGSDDMPAGNSVREARETAKLKREVLEHFDWEAILLAIQEYKHLRSWSNLRVSLDKLKAFCRSRYDWYTLFIPNTELEIHSYSDFEKQQKIMTQLLIDYTDRYYNALKRGYEGQFYEVIPLDEDNGSMLKLYQFELENSDDGNLYKDKLEELRDLVANGDIGKASKWNANLMVAISFQQHLYYPLIHLSEPKALPLKMRPIVFDSDSEVRFVKDLERFYESDKGREIIGNRSLYLMRNADTKNKGLGFATAGNFYPDFLLWLVDEETGKQWLTFVDPKGIRNIDLNHPKLRLYKEIEKIEASLGDPNITLNSVIVSGTSFDDLLNVRGHMTREELEDRNVVFMDDREYLTKLLNSVLN